MPSYFRFSQRDYDGDRQTVSIPSNMTAGNYATDSVLHDTLYTQVQLWTAGKQDGRDDVINRIPPSGGSAISPIAQKTTQLIIEMQDTGTGGSYYERIPMPNLAKAADGGSNPAWVSSGGLTVANTAHADYATFKSAIEAVYVSPNGNAGTLQKAYIEE